MVINGENESIKGIPYGISDYELIRTENYYYVDKTPYLNNLKKAGRYLFFIRPRKGITRLSPKVQNASAKFIHRNPGLFFVKDQKDFIRIMGGIRWKKKTGFPAALNQTKNTYLI